MRLGKQGARRDEVALLLEQGMQQFGGPVGVPLLQPQLRQRQNRLR